MNIQFKEIAIENFRSIENANVKLSQQGVVIVKGINNYEDKVLSNGSGKSSIFEAIVFALFEETSNGDKDVANRIVNKGYYLELLFNIDNIDYTIIRKNDGKKSEVKLLQGTKELSARNKTDTNKQIIQLLGINKNLFLDSVFLSQEAKTNLASLQPTARKERLEILTNTDNVVNSFKERLKDKQAEYEAKCINWEKEKNQIIGKIDTLLNQSNQYRQKINEIEKQIEYRNSLGNLDEIENNINLYLKSIDDLRIKSSEKTKLLTIKQQEIDKYKDDNKALLEKQNELILALNTEKSKLTKIQNEIDKKSVSIKYEEDNIKQANSNIDKILKSDTCPTCGRKYDNINEDHINNTINEYKKSIKEFENNIQELTNLKINLEKEVEKQKDIISEIEIKTKEFQKQIDSYIINGESLTTAKTNIQNEFDSINIDIVEYEKKLSKLRDLKDIILKVQVGNKQEFEDLLNENNKKLLKLQEDEKDISLKWESDNNYVGTIKHCQQLVTKDFRTYLLKNSIEYLNNILSKYSVELFSNEKDIIYITNDDTKLDIMLGNASYESLSGGEKTRVNIALLLAQKSLASIIGNMSCNIIILDEVLGYCDSSAETNIIDLITQELSSLETIYMVSHKEIQVASDSMLIIEKDSNGLSHIKEHW